jgi:hypothetical protein
MRITGNPAQSVKEGPVRHPNCILRYVTKSGGAAAPMGRYWGTNHRVPEVRLLVPEALRGVLRRYAERHLPDQPRYAVYLPCSLLAPATAHRLLVYHRLAPAMADGDTLPPPDITWPPKSQPLPAGQADEPGEPVY